ncbi:RfaG Glycosyltransferase [Sphingomonadaceae bacterium]
MSDKSATLMMVVTDAVSFNILCAGQLEYIRRHWSGRIVLVCGGSYEQVSKLIDRNVGDVVHLPQLRRRPSLFSDLISLIHLFAVIMRVRPVIVVYSTPKALLLASLVAFLAGVRVRLALIRGRVYENFKGYRRMVFVVLDRVSLGLSTHTVFISESLRKAYTEEGIVAPPKADVLGAGSSNGIDTLLFRPPSSMERRKCRQNLGLKVDEFAVLAVGRLCVDKGAREFCQIAERLGPPFRFFWVGSVEDQSLLSDIERAGKIGGNVEYIGQVENVLPYLWAADAHLFLTHREGFGNVAIEAAACGLQTVAFDVVGVTDSVANGVSGTRVPFADISAVAAVLMELQMSGSSRASDRVAARSWVEREFNQHICWSRWFQYLIRASERSTENGQFKNY